MNVPIALLRRTLWRRRVAAAKAWQDAERRAAAEHNDAVRRILDAGHTRRGYLERLTR